MLIIFFISLIVILFDRIIKSWIIKVLPLYASTEFIPNILNLNHVRNQGAAWNILNNQVDTLVVISVVAILYFIYVSYKHRRSNILQRILYGLIIGGSLGNLMDRIYYGYVIDMFEIKLFTFPIFNLADTCICMGMIGIIFLVLIKGEESIL